MTAQGREDLGLLKGETLTQGEALDRAAEDLDEARKSLEGDGGFPGMPGLPSMLGLFGPDKFGEYGATEAFDSFASAWNLECGTLAGALRELHGKIGKGVNLNTGTDGDAAGSFDSMAPGSLWDQQSKPKEELTQTGPAQGSSVPR